MGTLENEIALVPGASDKVAVSIVKHLGAGGDRSVVDNSVGDVLHEIFTAALLLTGSLERAERSVLEAINAVRPDQLSASAVFRATTRIAVTQEIIAGEEQSQEQEPPVSWLPLELRRVLLLPTDDRHAFVLRLLLGLPRDQCSRLLHLEDGDLDKHIVSAVLKLASIKAQENDEPGMLGVVA